MSCLSSFDVCACSLFVCVCVCVQSTTSCVVARDNGTWLGFHIRLLNLRMLCSKTQRNTNTNTSDLLMMSSMWRINLGMNHTRTRQGDTEWNKLQLGMTSGTNIVLSALTLHEQVFTLKKFLLSLKDQKCNTESLLQAQVERLFAFLTAITLSPPEQAKTFLLHIHFLPHVQLWSRTLQKSNAFRVNLPLWKGFCDQLFYLNYEV